MGVAMSDEEAWDFIARSHTGILTTLRRDGWPVALPLWFAVDDRRIYIATPVHARKLRRIANDDRGSFLVEAGERWAELAAVHLPVRARILDPEHDEDEMTTATQRLTEKYPDLQSRSKQMPEASRNHYRSQRLVRLVPAGPPLSWDNAKIRPRHGGR
jgi:hypothetical protein